MSSRTRVAALALIAGASPAFAQAPHVHKDGPADPGAPSVQVVAKEGERRVDVLVDGKPFTAYVWPTNVKKPSLYPIRTASGKAVTRGFPVDPAPGERVDHPHHVGLWFNYGDVNGLDFWNNSEAIKPADAPKMGTVLHRRVRGTENGKGVGALEVTTEWVNQAGKALLREDTRFEFRATRDGRAIDRITTLTALDEPVRFKDNKEGVLGLRVTRALEQPADKPEIFTDAQGRPTPVAVLNNEGVTGKYRSAEGKEGDAVWGTRARWTTLGGVLQGEPVTLAILDHPTNVGYPTYWHARGYGLFAANPLGQAALSNGKETLDFKLAPGQSTTFRHRLLILTGAATPEQVEAQFKEFSGR